MAAEKIRGKAGLTEVLERTLEEGGMAEAASEEAEGPVPVPPSGEQLLRLLLPEAAQIGRCSAGRTELR